MKNMNIVAYLYFLNRYNGTNNSFYSAIFHFHRYISLETDFSWNKLFWFEEDFDYPKDSDFDKIIRTLFHHQYIDLELKVTEEGKVFLALEMDNFEEFRNGMTLFNDSYKGQSFKEDSCYIKNASFPISCHECTDRICKDARFNAQDFFDLINFKGFKNPYKKVIHKNPYSSKIE